MTATPRTTTAPGAVRGARGRGWTWVGESAGSVADLGVLVPIAVAMIVVNGLSPTAVLLPVGLTYLVVAWHYRLPVAVQPLKAFGAVAIAVGAGPDVIAAGALLMGVLFVVLGLTGWLDRLARAFPVPVVRGVQLAVALTFVMIGYGLVVDPPASFAGSPGPALAVVVALALTAVLVLRPSLVLVAVLGAWWWRCSSPTPAGPFSDRLR